MPRFRRVNTAERRAAPRMPASKAPPHRLTRVSSGLEVKLVNIGLNGTILINCTEMLSPGAQTRLKLEIQGASINLEGRIRRCRVINIRNNKIQYEAAIILDGQLPQSLADQMQRPDEKGPIKTAASNSQPAQFPKTAQIWIGDANGTGAQV